MKTIATILFFLIFITAQAQSQKAKKDVYSILETYEKAVVPYLEEKIRKEATSSATEKSKAITTARRLSLGATIEGINKETRIKFKEERWDITNIQLVKDFIEYRYRVDIGGLPEEFYKKVSEELDKS
jgi:hypothetical protein